jgi:peptide/nickel transport system substrate-binding protein
MRTLAGCVLLPLLLLGCTGSGEEPEVLRVCLEGTPRDLDPRYGSDESSRRVHSLLHAGLVRFDADGSPVGDLAESWERLEPTRYRFLLREGLRFSDGTPLTAEDVAATLGSVAREGSRSFRHGDLRRIRRMRVLSDREIEIELAAPFAPLLANLNLGILPARQAALETLPEPPVGAGPYRLVRALPDREVLVEANPHYHEGPPATASILLKILPNETTRSLELTKGSLDLAINDLPPDLVDHLVSTAGLRVVTSPGNAYAYLGFNLRHAPLDDLRVRRAIAQAIDREAIIRHLLRGRARPATGLLPPENWAYLPTEAPPYAPQAARALLDAAGYREPPEGGPRLQLVYKTSTSELANQQAQVIQEQLRRVGVSVEIRSAEWSTFYDDIVHGRFEMYSLTWTEILDPDVYRLRFGSGYVPPDGLNRGGYRNPRVDALLEEGLVRDREDERRPVYAEIQRILAEDLPYVSLWHRDNIAVVRGRVTGLELDPTADFRALKDVRLREP